MLVGCLRRCCSGTRKICRHLCSRIYFTDLIFIPGCCRACPRCSCCPACRGACAVLAGRYSVLHGVAPLQTRTCASRSWRPFMIRVLEVTMSFLGFSWLPCTSVDRGDAFDVRCGPSLSCSSTLPGLSSVNALSTACGSLPSLPLIASVG